MPKAKQRKAPLTGNSTAIAPSTAAQACRNTIQQFHVLLKRRSQLESRTQPESSNTKELALVNGKLDLLGGLDTYQQLSALGQREERGGGTEKVLISWLKELDLHRRDSKKKLQLLEVGALFPDNFAQCQSWLDCTAMDLHSRHRDIIEQDFLKLDIKECRGKWDCLSLSLVLNFVSTPRERGKMLMLAHEFIAPGGFLFLALPLPCVANSRYLTHTRLKELMSAIGFCEIREKWRQGGKMGYWLYQKQIAQKTLFVNFEKKSILRSGKRNNFAILIDSR